MELFPKPTIFLLVTIYLPTLYMNSGTYIIFRVILNNYPVCRASFNLPSLRSIAVLVKHTNKPRQARAVKLPWGDWDGTNSYFSHDLNLSLSARFCSFTRFCSFLPFHGFVAQQHVWQNRHAMQAMIFIKKLKRGLLEFPLSSQFFYGDRRRLSKHGRIK